MSSLRFNPTLNLHLNSTLPPESLGKIQSLKNQFNSNMFYWGLVKSPSCNCGAEPQTTEHLFITVQITEPKVVTRISQHLNETTIRTSWN